MLLLLAAACGDSGVEKRDRELYQDLKSSDKMIFSTLSVTKTPRFDDSGFFGKRIGVFSYDTYLRAYIDMSLLRESDIVFDDKARTVAITLPPVQVEFSGRDMNMRQEYQNVTGFRSNFDSKERAEMKEKANADLKKEVASNPVFHRVLKESAMRKARIYFNALFDANGYDATVSFRENPDL